MADPYPDRPPRFSVPVSFMFDNRTRVPTVMPDTLILQPHESRVGPAGARAMAAAAGG